MIPPFDEAGNLPPGIYWATWDELVVRYATNEHRARLMRGLKKALLALKAANVHTAYVDGSFVTSKDAPRDYDACWEMEDLQPELLDPVFLELEDTFIQKAKYRGEFSPVDSRDTTAQRTFLQMFQIDKITSRPKGIIAIDLRGLKDD